MPRTVVGVVVPRGCDLQPGFWSSHPLTTSVLRYKLHHDIILTIHPLEYVCKDNYFSSLVKI